jgi:hypothetical protein
MFIALLGALSAQLLLSRLHDVQLRRLMSNDDTSDRVKSSTDVRRKSRGVEGA